VLVDGDAVGISHLRTDLADRLRAPAFALEIGFLAAGAGISTWLAFRAAARVRAVEAEVLHGARAQSA